MKLRRFTDHDAFYHHTEAFLLAHEAEHNLILGVCRELRAQPVRSEPPYLAAVEDADIVVAAALLTPPHNIVLSRATALDAMPPIARDVRSRNLYPPGVLGPPSVSLRFARIWQEHTGASFRMGMAMRIYQLTAVSPVPNVPGVLRRATATDRDLLVTWMAACIRETGASGESPEDAPRVVDASLADPTQPFSLWCVDGTPVSMAKQTGPTPHGIRVNAVYTPPAFRRNGYASACVAALSQRLLDSGYRFCFLFTNRANPTSNHIYQTVGFQPVADVHEYRFAPAGTARPFPPAGG
jgi:predicted GNAT family acetyltransferase